MNNRSLELYSLPGVLAIVRLADAQQGIFLVRHAEDVRSKDVVDRPLTESGQRRGMLLASILGLKHGASVKTGGPMLSVRFSIIHAALLWAR
jgi:hypothetical protein